MRKILLTHKDILLTVEKLALRVDDQDAEIKLVFDYLKKLNTHKKVEFDQASRKRIGFTAEDTA